MVNLLALTDAPMVTLLLAVLKPAVFVVVVTGLIWWAVYERRQMMRIPEDLSIETQKKLCDQHVTHFTKLVARGQAGDRSVRIVECDQYLEIWTRGRASLELGATVPPECAQEIGDAVWSGDADELMTPEELERWNKYLNTLDDSEEA